MCGPGIFSKFHAISASILLALSTAFSASAATQDRRPISTDTVEQRIDRIENNLLPEVVPLGIPLPKMTLADRLKELHIPGVSIAVIHNGKIEWARGFGVTRIGGPKVTADTLFQAGSVSKPTAAMAILNLVQSGKLDLDTDVNQYLKSWKIPPNPFMEKQPVTLRELLTHTGGITVHGFLVVHL
jgi:CubicO group peptidase (beta-lactamase class C family)